MRKITALIALILILALPALAEGEAIRVGALKGPTAMGLVSLMDQNDGTYEFTLSAAPDEVAPKIVKGELDIACIPANLAAVLYNNTQGGVKVLNINTLGILYIVERGDSIQSVADLKGRTLYASGKGATPEYALNTILTGSGLDPETDLTIEYKSEHAECLAALLNDPEAVAMLPQPFVTVAQSKAEDLRIALDLTKEWDALEAGKENPSTLVVGVTVARTDFIEAHPEQIEAFLAAYEQSIAFTNEHVAEAAQLIGKFDIFEAAVAEKALPYCNIAFIAGEEMKGKLGGYLVSLFDQEPAAVGGALPDDAFYYVP